MTDERLLELFRIAWEGIRSLPAPRRERAREYYYRELRRHRAPEPLRGVMAELCAEGGIEAGGLPLEGEEEFLGLWQAVSGRTEHTRDLCLMAAAAVVWSEDCD